MNDDILKRVCTQPEIAPNSAPTARVSGIASTPVCDNRMTSTTVDILAIDWADKSMPPI